MDHSESESLRCSGLDIPITADPAEQHPPVGEQSRSHDIERDESGELPPSFYYAHVPALGLTTHGEGIEGARAPAEDLVKLLSEKRSSGRVN